MHNQKSNRRVRDGASMRSQAGRRVASRKSIRAKSGKKALFTPSSAKKRQERMRSFMQSRDQEQQSLRESTQLVVREQQSVSVPAYMFDENTGAMVRVDMPEMDMATAMVVAARQDIAERDVCEIPEIDTALTRVGTCAVSKARRGYKAKKSMTKRVIAAATAVVSLAAAGLSAMWMGLFDPSVNYVSAKEVYFDGYPVGVVTDGKELEEIIEDIYANLSEEYGMSILANQRLVMEDTMVDPKYIAAPEEVGEAVRQSIDMQVNAVVISVDGISAVALPTPEDAQWVLDQLLEPFNEDAESVQFVEDVEIGEKDISHGLLKDKQEAVELLTMGAEAQVPYTVQSGDTLWEIADKNNLSVKELRDANPQVATSDDISIGMQLNLTKPQRLVNVSYSKTEHKDTEIPYETKTVSDSSLYVSQMKTTQKGKPGISRATIRVDYINGQEVDRTTLKEEEIQAPVTEIIARGTKELPTSPVTPSGGASGGGGNGGSGGGGGANKVAASGFMIPVSGYRISSTYGPRWGGMHSGLDMACSYGTPIKASKAGTVVTAGWTGGYGYMIEIDHGGGVRTRYAHCSKLFANVGQKVSQGTVIAQVGSTGKSTGNHLHFEIRINGAAVNPQKYI
jgi:murein DD-endopeptidase MepM/ murein hydrolase activator NlpD